MLDAKLNSKLQIVSCCLRATPMNQLPILAGTPLANFRMSAATRLHKVTMERPHCAHLKSQHPFTSHAQELLKIPADVSENAWGKFSLRIQWISAEPTRLHRFDKDPGEVSGQDFPRKQWMTLNSLRTGVGHLRTVG